MGHHRHKIADIATKQIAHSLMGLLQQDYL
jgi:hypothetical protein